MKIANLLTSVGWLTAAEERLFDLDKRELGPQPKAVLKSLTDGSRAVIRSDVWYEESLGPDWIAAFRLCLDQEQKRIAIGELRIFPSAGPREDGTGRWIGEALGCYSPVPVGGLKARTLRKVTLRAFVPHLREPFDKIGWSFEAAPSEGPSGRGRKPRPDQQLATAAVLYETAWLAGLTYPTSEVRRLMRLSESSARSIVAAARRRGFLTPTSRGRTGGHASVEAKQIGKAFAEAIAEGGQRKKLRNQRTAAL